MADISDVTAAIKGLVVATLYPTGNAPASAAGMRVVAYAGWPIGEQLDADLAIQRCHVSVRPLESERNTTRFKTRWRTTAPAVTSVMAQVSGRVLTLSGSATALQNVMVICNGIAKSTRINPSDTLPSIASAIASQFPGAAASGVNVTFPPSTFSLVARVGGIATVSKEIGRIEREFMVTIWADDPDRRTAIARLLTPVLMDTRYLSAPDGSMPRMTYRRSVDMDEKQRYQIFRRDIVVVVEIPITKSAQAAQVLAETHTVTPNGSGSPVASKTI